MPLPDSLQALVDRVGSGTTSDTTFASAIAGAGAALSDLRAAGRGITKGLVVDIAGPGLNEAAQVVVEPPDLSEEEKPGYVDMTSPAVVASVAKGGGEDTDEPTEEEGEDCAKGTTEPVTEDIAKGEPAPALEPAMLEASDIIKGISDNSTALAALQEENAILKGRVETLQLAADANAAQMALVLSRLDTIAAGQETIAKGLADQGEALGTVLENITKGVGEHYLLDRDRGVSTFPSGQGRTGRFDPEPSGTAALFSDQVLLKGIGESVLTHAELSRYNRNETRGVFSANPDRHAAIVAKLSTYN